MRLMRGTKKKWDQSDFFILDTVEYRPERDQLRVRFRNRDVGEVATSALWRDRPGQPNWNEVAIDPATRSAILVPTLSGQPTTEGPIAEIPSDVIRVALDEEFRSYMADRATEWKRTFGQRVAALRKSRGLTRAAVALAAGVEEKVVTAIEGGQGEASLATIAKVVSAMGARLEDLPATKAS
jgi:DNA-binding XRE family transcriptional regulator